MVPTALLPAVEPGRHRGVRLLGPDPRRPPDLLVVHLGDEQLEDEPDRRRLGLQVSLLFLQYLPRSARVLTRLPTALSSNCAPKKVSPP